MERIVVTLEELEKSREIDKKYYPGGDFNRIWEMTPEEVFGIPWHKLER